MLTHLCHIDLTGWLIVVSALEHRSRSWKLFCCTAERVWSIFGLSGFHWLAGLFVAVLKSVWDFISWFWCVILCTWRGLFTLAITYIRILTWANRMNINEWMRFSVVAVLFDLVMKDEWWAAFHILIMPVASLICWTR